MSDLDRAPFAPTIDDAATDALGGKTIILGPGQAVHMPGTLARAYSDAQQRAIDRLDAALERAFEMISEAFARIAKLEAEAKLTGTEYRG